MTLVYKANTKIYWPSQSAGFLAYNEGDVVPDANVSLYGYVAAGVVTQVDVSTAVPGSGGSAHSTVDALNAVKAGLPFSVKDYGAVGNGSTDDATAIQAAITAAVSAGGGIVLFPIGTFMYGTSLNLTPGGASVPLVLQGMGSSSILKTATGSSAHLYNSNGVTGGTINDLTMRDLVLDGNKALATGTQSTMSLDGALRFTAINVTFQNAQGYGFGMQSFPGRLDGRTGDQKDAAFIRCQFRGNDLDGVDIKYCVGVTFTDCISTGNGIEGYDVRGYDVVWKGCRAESNGGKGWEFLSVVNNVGGSSISQKIGHTLIGCIARSNTSYGYSPVVQTPETQPFTLRFVGCEASSNLRGLQVATSTNDILDLQIAGFTANSNTEYGISLENTRCKAVAISNVVARANGSHGVRIDDLNVVMSNVVCVSNTGSGVVMANAATGGVLSGGRTSGNAAPQIGSSGGTAGLDALRISEVNGFKTKSNGTVTVGAAATSQVTAHGLSRAPTAANFTVTPTSTLGSAAKFWISSVGGTNFTINTDVVPGGSGATFAWSADVNPA